MDWNYRGWLHYILVTIKIMETFNLIIKRNEKASTNQEFRVIKDYNENHKSSRFFRNNYIIMYEFDIIEDMGNNIYKTENKNGTFTICEVNNGENDIKYLTSHQNETGIDNIENLPTY